MSIYDTLNKEQKKAVFQTEGAVLILAGAGSGKTRVITHRIAYLMDECQVNPWNILAITFTNKAAGEMRERVDSLIGYGAQSVWISTFHSMCGRILRRYIDRIGYDTSFVIYDTDDQKTLIKEICKKRSIDPKEFPPKMFLGAISSAKNELMTPLKYRETVMQDYRTRLTAEVYEEYQKMLHKNNALDFDDMLMKTVELFHADEEVLKGYQNRFRYIMVDEYQDTNTAQFELIRLLAAGSGNLCVVGDDDQSIYKFRGANIRNILDFEKNYPDALVIKLEQNYRSTQTVLDAANAVIRHNTTRKEKKLWTDQGEGSRIHFRRFNSAPEEASYIARDIDAHMQKDHRISYRDFAVLYRTNAQSRLLEEQLVLRSIPYNIVGGTNFYDRREIKDMLCYLKTVNNGTDDLAVRRILNVPRRGIGAVTVNKVAEFAAENDLSFFEALENTERIHSLGSAGKKIEPFVDMIHILRQSIHGASLEELLKKIVEMSRYVEELKASDEDDAEDRIQNIDELISKIAAYEDSAEEPSLTGFLEEVALVADIDQMEENDDRVLLMTLHSAKGLEFPHVYLAGMEEGVFPSQMALDSMEEDAVEEERRLAYVGITRAKKELTMTYAMSRMLRGDIRYSAVSRFVLEIPEDLLDETPRLTSGGYAEPPVKKEKGRSFLNFGGYHEGGFDSYSSPSFGGRSSYGGVSYSSSYGSSYGERSTYGTKGSVSSSAGKSRDGRLKAVYVKPHTSDDRKPFIAKTQPGLQKGMPAKGKHPDYDAGDRVLHIKYGEGTVVSVEDNPRDYKVTINFDEAGQKIMYAAFARLEKI